MLIDALVNCYNKLVEKGSLPPYGYVETEIALAVDIDIDGKVKNIYSLGSSNDERPTATFIVPENYGHSKAENSPGFLFDNTEYVLGCVPKDKKPVNTARRFKYFKDFQMKVLEGFDDDFSTAIKNFCKNYSYDGLTAEQKAVIPEKTVVKAMFMFNDEYAVDNKNLRSAWEKYLEEKIANNKKGISCITGKYDYLAAEHPNLGTLVNIKGADKVSCNLVSFGKDSFCCFGKNHEDKAYNYPIDVKSASAYSNALYYMTKKNPSYKMSNMYGSYDMIFWAEDMEEEYNNVFNALFSNPFFVNKESKEETIEHNIMYQDHLKYIFDCIAKGKPIKINDKELRYDNDFYIAEIGVNGRRLFINKFLRKDFGSILKNVAEHYNDLKIVKNFETDYDNIPLYNLVVELYPPNKMKKLEKADTGARIIEERMYNSMIDGEEYPIELLERVINRIKAEPDVLLNYTKAAMLKAVINRRFRKNGVCGNLKEEITVGLNENSNDVSYNLGRLFAVYYRVQNLASKNSLNSTIKDRFFAGASENPSEAFPMLNRLSLVHLEKLYFTDKEYYTNLIADILYRIDAFPKRLRMEEQGAFYLGYYHQLRFLFEEAKKAKAEREKQQD